MQSLWVALAYTRAVTAMAKANEPKSSLDARDHQLVESQLQMVKTIAHSLARRLPPSVDRADLVQDGVLGLMEALLRWTKETTGSHFDNYIAQRTHGAMLDGLRAMDHGSRQVRREMRRVEQAIQTLSHQLGRMPREREIAQALDMPLPQYQRLLQEAEGYLLISLQDLVGDDSELYLEHCAEHHADPLVVLERASLREALARAIKALPPQKRTLLRLYYSKDLKMREIGEHLGLSEARISQLHAQTIAQLRVTMPDGDIAALLKPRRQPRASESSAPAV